MSTTTRQPATIHAHEPAHCAYVRTHYQPDGGRRLEFACPSSDGTADHRFYVDDDGGRPSCDCRAVVHRGHCTLTMRSVEVVATHYARLAAAMGDADLADDDLWAQRKCETGRLTAGERLEWQAIRDELARRADEWEARNLDDLGRYRPLGGVA